VYLFENLATKHPLELIDACFSGRISKRNLCKLFAVHLPNTTLTASHMNGCGISSLLQSSERFRKMLRLVLQMMTGKSTLMLDPHFFKESFFFP